MRWSPLTAVLVLACVAAAGCETSDDKERKELEAAAAAVLGQGKDARAEEIEAKEAEERRKAFAEQKAQEEARIAKLDAIVAAVVKAPAEPSKDLLSACDGLVEVYADWVRAVYFDDDAFQLRFFDAKRKNLGAVKTKCAKLASVPATDCMVEVIRAVTAEDFSEAERKLIQAQPEYLFNKCTEQF
jgi:hypothetical protein